MSKITQDPVDKGKEDIVKEAKEVLSSRDVQQYQIPTGGLAEDPFDNYPHPRGEVKDTFGKSHKAAHVVICVKPPHQDPSGKDYTIKQEYKSNDVISFGPYKGKNLEEIQKTDSEYAIKLIKEGRIEIAALGTYHNAVVRSHKLGKNIDVVFDREVVLADGNIPNVAIVEDNEVRAQLFYDLEIKSGKIVVDPHYAFLDKQQMPLLLQIFRKIHQPNKEVMTLVNQIDSPDKE